MNDSPHTGTLTPNLTEQRERMIGQQLRSRGIRDERVLAAMSKIPRELFIFPEYLAEAYGDHPLPIGQGQTISQPYIVASMAQAADIAPEHRVLEVGTGTGYEAAVLGELAGEVWTIERFPELADRAREILASLRYENVHVEQGDGSLGLMEHAPYDRILVAAAAPRIPEPLLTQLKDGGRLVIPIGSRIEQQLQVVRKLGNEIVVTQRELCRFVSLIGAEGWEP